MSLFSYLQIQHPQLKNRVGTNETAITNIRSLGNYKGRFNVKYSVDTADTGIIFTAHSPIDDSRVTLSSVLTDIGDYAFLKITVSTASWQANEVTYPAFVFLDDEDGADMSIARSNYTGNNPFEENTVDQVYVVQVCTATTLRVLHHFVDTEDLKTDLATLDAAAGKLAADNSFTGSNTFTKAIINDVVPSDSTHVVNKSYVDTAIQGLDWQESVLDMVDFTTAEPAAPTEGDRYINTVSGDSSETTTAVLANYIYEWDGADWIQIAPDEGTAVWVEDEDHLKVWNGTAWVRFGSTVLHNNLSTIQGGQATEYYHLTNTEHTNVTATSQNEWNQVHNIGDVTTISADQWGYVGATDQGVATTDDVKFGTVTVGDEIKVATNVGGDLVATNINSTTYKVDLSHADNGVLAQKYVIQTGGTDVTLDHDASDRLTVNSKVVASGKNLNDDIDANAAEITNLEDYEVHNSEKDGYGIFTETQFKRYSDGSLFRKSVLSGGTSPQYTTRTETWYDTDGTTVLRTNTYTLAYDGDVKTV
jgi:hypothetical protein